MRIKKEKDSRGKEWALQEYSCRVCSRCWLYVEKGHCIFGGPFSGYIKDDTNKKV